MVTKIKRIDGREQSLFTGQLNRMLEEAGYSPAKFSITDGDDGVLDDIFSYQVYNKIKNHWRGATRPTGIVAGMVWNDSDNDRLYLYDGTNDIELFTENTKAPLENLLSNALLGVWLESSANKGLTTLTFDSGSTEPSIGAQLDGATSAASGVLISFNVATGTWGGNDAAGTFVLGGVSGCFQDSEDIDINGGTANIASVNGEPGIAADDCQDDGTGSWTDADSILTFNTSYYEVSSDAVNEKAYLGGSFAEGRLYKIHAQLKDGTATPDDIQLVSLNGATVEAYSKDINTTGSFVVHTFTFRATANTDGVGIRTPTSLASNNIQMKLFACYEIVPCGHASDTRGLTSWHRSLLCDVYREPMGSNTKDGACYALKIVPNNTSSTMVSWPGNDHISSGSDQWTELFSGRTVTFGAWVKTATANHCRLVSQGTTVTNSSYHTGGGTYEWLEVTKTMPDSPNYVNFSFSCNASVVTSGDTIIYISQPMVVFGNILGEGNFRPRMGELVFSDGKYGAPSNAMDYTAPAATSTYEDVNIEADSDGCLPEGTKAAYFHCQLNDAGSAAGNGGLHLRINTTAPTVKVYPKGLTNDTAYYKESFFFVDADGNFEYYAQESGSGTLDIQDFTYMGAQL